jgi:gliding motility-associated-like protein
MIGLNIFTQAKKRMKQLLFFIFLTIFSGLAAQISVHADVTSGCKPLQVNFSILPASATDTISTIEWNFGNWTTLRSELSPAVIFTSSGKYDVICTINGSFNITENDFINVIDCSDTLNIPNVFSPNDDNINDFFEIETNGISSYSFEVYTRSGTLVYKSESPTIFWDGRSLSGQKMKNGIYFYIIRQLEGEPLNEVNGIVYLYE